MNRETENIKESELTDWRLLKQFRKLFGGVLKDRPRSKSEDDPRRKLHYLDYATSILFVFCNPVINSMRGLCAASRLKKVQKCATKGYLSLASFSEAQHTFDASALQQLVCKLAAKIAPDKLKNKDILPAVKDLVAVDGSLFQTLSRVFWADWLDDSHKAIKLHLGFSVIKKTAVNAVITAGNKCERKALLEMVEEGVMYVCDRYYGLDYAFFEVMDKLGALFTIRIRNKPKYTVLEDYELTKEDLKEGVISDQLVQLGDPERDLPPVRMVKTNAFGGKEILLVCSEPPEKISAALVSLIYRQRWQIEVFFKWLKSLLGCRRLLAESSNGVAIQMYCALITAILMFDQFGKIPTKRQMEMLQFYFMEFISYEELEEAFAEKKKG